jgi:hypothetical protein
VPVPNQKGWCPFAGTARPSPNFWTANSGRKAVVLHIAEGGYASSRDWLCSPASGVSSHFIVGPAGELAQLVSIYDSAWGNGLTYGSDGRWFTPGGHPVRPLWSDIVKGVNPNRYTISIEHAGHSGDVPSDAMLATTARLLRWLGEIFRLAWVPGRTLIRHTDINPVDKSRCPGPGFDLAHIAALASRPSGPAVRRFVALVPVPVFEARDPAARIALNSQAVIDAGDVFEVDDVTAGWAHVASGLGFVTIGALKEQS